jgi:signal peptidase II
VPSRGPVSASSTRPPASSVEVTRPAAPAVGWIIAATAAVVVVLDQATKAWALAALDEGPIELIGSLRLRLTFNSGTAFSLGEGRGGLISLLGLVVVVFLVRTVLEWGGRLPAVGAGLVAGGAIGNLIDRVAREGSGSVLGGNVVDFVDLQWWPVFNVADMGIVVGAILLAILSFRAEQ